MSFKESVLFTYKSPWTYPCIPPSWVEAISIDNNTIKRGRPEIRQKWGSIIHSKTGWKIASSFFWRKVLMSWQFLYNSTQKVYVENFHKYSQFSNSTLTRIPNCFWAGNLTKFPFLFGMTFRPVTTVSARNDVWAKSAEISYWWHVTTKIWVGRLTGWSKFSTNQKHYPHLGSDVSIIWNFCARCMSFRVESSRMASKNVGCFLRLWLAGVAK